MPLRVFASRVPAPCHILREESRKGLLYVLRQLGTLNAADELPDEVHVGFRRTGLVSFSEGEVERLDILAVEWRRAGRVRLGKSRRFFLDSLACFSAGSVSEPDFGRRLRLEFIFVGR